MEINLKQDDPSLYMELVEDDFSLGLELTPYRIDEIAENCYLIFHKRNYSIFDDECEDNSLEYVSFFYGSDSIQFHFSMFCEVGALYQPYYLKWLQLNNAILDDCAELNGSPYYIQLIKYQCKHNTTQEKKND